MEDMQYYPDHYKEYAGIVKSSFFEQLKKPYVLDERNRWPDEGEASLDSERKLWGGWYRKE